MIGCKNSGAKVRKLLQFLHIRPENMQILVHLIIHIGQIVQIQGTFGSQIEDKVYDGEVWQKTMFVGEDLVVGEPPVPPRGRACAWGRNKLGGARYDMLLSVHACPSNSLSSFGEWLRVGPLGPLKGNKFYTFQNEFLIQVHEPFPPFIIYRAEVILEIFKEGRVVVARLEGIPMLFLPVAMVAYQYILHQALALHKGTPIHRDGERKRPVRRIDPAPVVQSLLLIVCPLFYQNWFVRLQQSNEPTYRW